MTNLPRALNSWGGGRKMKYFTESICINILPQVDAGMGANKHFNKYSPLLQILNYGDTCDHFCGLKTAAICTRNIVQGGDE